MRWWGLAQVGSLRASWGGGLALVLGVRPGQDPLPGGGPLLQLHGGCGEAAGSSGGDLFGDLPARSPWGSSWCRIWWWSSCSPSCRLRWGGSGPWGHGRSNWAWPSAGWRSLVGVGGGGLLLGASPPLPVDCRPPEALPLRTSLVLPPHRLGLSEDHGALPGAGWASWRGSVLAHPSPLLSPPPSSPAPLHAGPPPPGEPAGEYFFLASSS